MRYTDNATRYSEAAGMIEAQALDARASKAEARSMPMRETERASLWRKQWERKNRERY